MLNYRRSVFAATLFTLLVALFGTPSVGVNNSRAARSSAYEVCGTVTNITGCPIDSFSTVGPVLITFLGTAPIQPFSSTEICFEVFDPTIPPEAIFTLVTADVNDECEFGICAVEIISFRTTELCFSASNVLEEPITGIGFDLVGIDAEPGAFTLNSVNPSPQLGNQGLNFLSDPGPVPQSPKTILDFAVATGSKFAGGNPQAGIQPGDQSSNFCIGGNFEGSTNTQIYVRTRSGFFRCPPPAGGGTFSLSLGTP